MTGPVVLILERGGGDDESRGVDESLHTVHAGEELKRKRQLVQVCKVRVHVGRSQHRYSKYCTWVHTSM